MKNTYAKISHVTGQQVVDRLMSANTRVAIAASEMVGIYYRRETAVIQVPADCPMVALQPMGDLPEGILAATEPQRVNTWFARSDAKSPIYRSEIWNAGSHPLVRSDATPAQIVAAIHAADAYAAYVEEVAAKYRSDVAQAIVEHVGSQVEAVNELAGLVAQV